MADANDAATTGTKPDRGIALLLALLGPWGAGHFYLGQSKRALFWLGISSVIFPLGSLVLLWLGGVIGYGLVFCGLGVGFLGVWIASLLELSRVPEARLRRTAVLKVVVYWLLSALFTTAVRFPIRVFVIEAFKIPAGSMQPSLMAGDHLMVDKLVFRVRRPKRGETMVFRFPEHREQDFVKRVIAVSGDRLEVREGHPWLNGWEVPHCLVGNGVMPSSDGGVSSGDLYIEYLDGEAYLTFFDEGAPLSGPQGPWTVADNEFWVLGDNRNNSHDSRSWFGGSGGGVPLDDVRGRALFRWLSVTDAGVDWSRFGTGASDPLLPGSMKKLQGALDRCMAERPPREKTVPPAAR